MRAHFLAATLSLLVAVVSVGAQAQINPFNRSGFELTTADVELVKEAARKLYIGETAAAGTVEEWSNAKSGNSGTIRLVGTFNHKGLPCRRLQHDISIAKVSNSYRFVVDRCKVASGEWKLL